MLIDTWSGEWTDDATGDAFADGLSMTQVGREWSVTKATVSKYCRSICEKLQILPSRYMRTEEAADKFRLSNRRPVKINGHKKKI